jgi:hypothetical protein
MAPPPRKHAGTDATATPRARINDNDNDNDTENGYWPSLFARLLNTPLPNMNNRSPFRGGMQVHAVPETERAMGANGQRLPWAYEYAE